MTGDDLGPLRDLVGIDGADSTLGCSLYIVSNDKLTALDALGNLRGSLPGGLYVDWNPILASLSGLDGVARVNAGGLVGSWTYSLLIYNNPKLCMTDTDRTRLTSCDAGTTCSSASACDSGNCGGTSLAIADNGKVHVQARFCLKNMRTHRIFPFHVKRHRLHHFVLVF